MKIAVRVDASRRIGSGHLMRCLSLAESLRKDGAQTTFFARPLPPHLRQEVLDAGHQLHELPEWAEPDGAIEAPWSRDRAAQDLAETRSALGQPDWEWLVVDHYGATRAWETGLRSMARRILAVDDLGRAHDCDLLLDSNFRPAGDTPYLELPETAVRLLGPGYALLRPEFADAHRRAAARQGPVRSILVFMGGMDASNTTGMVLRAVKVIPPSQRPRRIDVVVGPAHSAKAEIESECSLLGANFHPGTREMAKLCLNADLAVGAAGSSTWERCAVGLPAVCLCLAENQRRILQNAAAEGVLYAPDDPMDHETLALHLRALIGNSRLLSHISRRALASVDGQGARRVAALMLT